MFGYTIGAYKYAGLFYSVLARAGYGLAGSASFAFRDGAEQHRAVRCMGNAQRRQHGDGLRGRGRGFYRLGNHFTAVYWRYHEYGHQCAHLFLPSLLELG